MNSVNKECKPDYFITKEELVEDIDFYTSKVMEMHGNPFRLISKEEFQAKAEEIKTRVHSLDTDEIHVSDCYYILQELAASIQDGHTKIFSPSNWEDAVDGLFPLKFVYFEDRIYISENLGEIAIPECAEILRINDKPIQEMMKETIKYVEGTLHHYKMVQWLRYFALFIHTYYKMESPWSAR